jgi:predicted O-methyltransferase YrrM
MSESWSVVDAYLNGVLLPGDAIADATLAANAAAGLPAIDVSPTQGRLLQLLVRMSGARQSRPCRSRRPGGHPGRAGA